MKGLFIASSVFKAEGAHMDQRTNINFLAELRIILAALAITRIRKFVKFILFCLVVRRTLRCSFFFPIFDPGLGKWLGF